MFYIDIRALRSANSLSLLSSSHIQKVLIERKELRAKDSSILKPCPSRQDWQVFHEYMIYYKYKIC